MRQVLLFLFPTLQMRKLGDETINILPKMEAISKWWNQAAPVQEPCPSSSCDTDRQVTGRETYHPRSCNQCGRWKTHSSVPK